MINKLKTNHFTLVLSGGGALAIAHLGVLNDLEKQYIVPNEIVGTSMGGIIGACMSIGLDEEEILEHIKSFSSVTTWIKFSLSGNAIVDNSKIKTIFNDIFQDRKMNNSNPFPNVANRLLLSPKPIIRIWIYIFVSASVVNSY